MAPFHLKLDNLRQCCFIFIFIFVFILVLVKEGRPENEVLERLAKNIPDQWKKLGRRLKVDEADLKAIHLENEEPFEKAFQMLLKWKKAKGTEATYLVLYMALCHDLVECKELAENFCCVGLK